MADDSACTRGNEYREYDRVKINKARNRTRSKWKNRERKSGEIPLISIYESIRVQKEFDKQAEGSRTTTRNLNEGRQNEIGGIQTLSE